MKKIIIILGLIIIVVGAIGLVFLFGGKDSDVLPITSIDQEKPSQEGDVSILRTEIVYDGDVFFPEIFEVTIGALVVFVNQSNLPLGIEFINRPDLSTLDKIILGGTYSFPPLVDPGIYEYINVDDSSQGGRIEVK